MGENHKTKVSQIALETDPAIALAPFWPRTHVSNPTRRSVVRPEICVAITLTVHIVTRVNLKWRSFRLALFAVLVLIGAGCSGIRASHSISPASFFLPGLGKVEPVQPSLNSQNSILK